MISTFRLAGVARLPAFFCAIGSTPARLIHYLACNEPLSGGLDQAPYIDRAQCHPPPDRRNPVNQSNISQASEPTIRLRNGRMIGFLQVGKADGPAVFHFHGHGSSRLEALLVSEQAVSLGVRLIALDRPGIGRSSANEGYRLLDWPDDVSEVADQLGIGRFAVEGVSAGGVYALACAYKLPHRLTACRLISTVPPAALLRKAGPLWMRAGLSIVERLPVLFRLYLELLPDPAADERAMEKLLLRYASHLSEADRKLLQTAGLRKQLAQAMAESRRQGSRGNRYEARILAQCWGFKPEEIAFERIFLWHGQQDRFMPIAAARLLARKLPHRIAAFYPKDGHFSVLMEHTQEILNAVRG